MSNQINRKLSTLFVVSAFLVGVLGTAFVTSKSRPASPVARPFTEKEMPKKEGADAATNGLIKLSAEATETAGIRVETIRMSLLGDRLTVPGTVEVSPNRGAKITPTAAGKISRILVNLGDTVHAGQALAVLDSFEVAQAQAAVKLAESGVKQAQSAIQTAHSEIPQAQAGVRIAEAELNQTRTKQRSAETALARQKELAATGAFSQAPLQSATSELSQAQSDLLKAQTDLQTHTSVLQRAERLFKEELISRSELEQSQLEHRQDQNSVDRALLRVGITKQTLEREQKVFNGDLLTRQVVQTAEAEVRAAQGDVLKALQGITRAQQDVYRAEKGEQAAQTASRGAEAALSAAHINLFALTGSGQPVKGGQLTLFAPISGVIAERNVTQGQAVERATTLFVIENLSAVSVNAQVPEKDVANIRIGQTMDATVAAYSRDHFAGVVQSIAGRVDEKTRALSVRCLVENPGGRLRPEMFAKISLDVGARTNALAIPAAAIDEDGADKFVYVEEKDGFERRKVVSGRSIGTNVEIVSGLKVGEKIAVAGVFVLKSESKKSELKGGD